MAQAGDARSFPTAYIVGGLLVGVGLILGLARPLFFASAALGALVIFVGAAVEGSHSASPSNDVGWPEETDEIADGPSTDDVESPVTNNPSAHGKALEIILNIVAVLGSIVVGGVLLLLAVAIPLTVATLIWGPAIPTRQLLALPALDALDQARIALPDTVEGTYRLDVTFDDTSDDWRARPELLFPIDRPRDIRPLAERLEPAGWDLVGVERGSSGTDYAVFRGPSQPQSAEMPSFFDWRKATRFELGEIASAKVLESFPVSEASKITFEAPNRLVDATEPSADRRQPAAGEGIEKTIVKIDRDTEVIDVHLVGAAIRSTPEFVRDALESNWFPLLIPGGALGVVWRRLRKRDKAKPDSPPGDAPQSPPEGGVPAAGTPTIVTQRQEYDSTAVEERPNGTRQPRTPTGARAFTKGECRAPPTNTAKPVSPEATTTPPSSPRRAPPTDKGE
jgi:hypothetical protein